MGEPFLVGVNYPDPGLRKHIPAEALEAELSRIARLGAKAVRVFLLWEDFQPEKERVPDAALRKLESLLDAAGRLGLGVLPVFFCRQPGRGSLPDWLREPSSDPLPRPLDFYRDRELVRAQQLQIRAVAGAFGKHEALLGWDLGR